MLDKDTEDLFKFMIEGFKKTDNTLKNLIQEAKYQDENTAFLARSMGEALTQLTSITMAVTQILLEKEIIMPEEYWILKNRYIAQSDQFSAQVRDSQ